MGADGGSIPDRRDLVKTKGKSETTDKALLRELFFLCTLSRQPLTRPVVLDPLGKLYNKDAVLEFFLDKTRYGDGDRICGYLRGVKDLLTLNLTTNPTYSPPDPSTMANVSQRAPFACPLSLKEMSGTVPFIALRPCGCVFSEAAVRAVIPNLTRGAVASKTTDETPDSAQPVVEKKEAEAVACPNCGKDIYPAEPSTVSPINPPREVQEDLLEQLLIARAAVKAGKKRKVGAMSGGVTGKAEGVDVDAKVRSKDKGGEVEGISAPRAKAARTTHTAPPAIADSTASGRQTVAQKLAAQEQKRLAAQAGMSDAVRGMFKAKENEKAGGGAADFFGRTFNRYA